MDIEAIQRALREGPVDEPRYVPGAFHWTHRRFSVEMTASVVTAVLVSGVALGVALSELRQPNGGVGRRDLDVLAAELEGRWVSEAISREEWVSSTLTAGHEARDIDAFLLHDPFESQVAYELVFQDEHLQVFGAFDGSPPESLPAGL